MDERNDFSYGIVPVRFLPDGAIEYLLIKHQVGHWGFPKGHAEGQELSYEAAARELHEEVGLKIVQRLTEEPILESYQYMRGEERIAKQVQYWLAIVSGELLLQVKEVQEAAWLLYEEAYNCMEFTESKATLASTKALLAKTTP